MKTKIFTVEVDYCKQMKFQFNMLVFSADCLYINMFVVGL